MAIVLLFIIVATLLILRLTVVNISASPTVSLRFQRYAREAQIHYPEQRDFDLSQAYQAYAARVRTPAGDDAAFRARPSGSRIG